MTRLGKLDRDVGFSHDSCQIIPTSLYCPPGTFPNAPS
jgi:hypothetical protein